MNEKSKNMSRQGRHIFDITLQNNLYKRRRDIPIHYDERYTVDTKRTLDWVNLYFRTRVNLICNKVIKSSPQHHK